MRTPEQISEAMMTEMVARCAGQHMSREQEIGVAFDIIAHAIARECARAKLEAVEPSPGAEPLRSDGARHSDCTNCGGQSVTGGVFPPCEACGSTGDRVVQLEREAAVLRAIVAGVASEHPQSLCFSGDGTWRCFYCGCRMQAGADAATMHARDCLHRRATDALASGDHRNCVHDVTTAATECGACGDCRVCQGSCLGCGAGR